MQQRQCALTTPLRSFVLFLSFFLSLSLGVARPGKKAPAPGWQVLQRAPRVRAQLSFLFSPPLSL